MLTLSADGPGLARLADYQLALQRESPLGHRLELVRLTSILPVPAALPRPSDLSF
jgi:hypothetical protein